MRGPVERWGQKINEFRFQTRIDSYIHSSGVTWLLHEPFFHDGILHSGQFRGHDGGSCGLVGIRGVRYIREESNPVTRLYSPSATTAESRGAAERW